MEHKNSDHEARDSPPPGEGITVQGDVNTGGGHFIGRDNIIYIGGIKIPRAIAPILVIALIIGLAGLGFIAFNTFAITVAVTAPTPTATATVPTATPTITPPPTVTPLAFATGIPSETLILLATFHSTAATNVEAHAKIQRAIEAEAANYGEERLRVAIDPAELTADQRPQAEALGKRYNASIVIWGEDTGVEVIVNFLNLKEPNFDATPVTVTERERTQLANPTAYARFITNDLPQQMTFLALFAIGESKFLSGKNTEATSIIETAIATVPTDAKPIGLADAYVRLGWLYQSIPLGESTFGLKSATKSIEYFNQAEALDSTNPAIYWGRGYAYRRKGEYAAAIADFTRLIELAVDSRIGYAERGAIYEQQGNYDAAIADFSQVIQQNAQDEYGDNYPLYERRASVYIAQGKLEAALADYDKAIQLQPQDALAYVGRGAVYMAQGDLEAALQDFGRAIQTNPGTPSAYLNRGLVYLQQGKVDDALSDFNDYIDRWPSNTADVYIGRGAAYSMQLEFGAAIQDFDKAIQLKPDSFGAYYNRGLARYHQGNLPAAIADYDQAIILDPNQADAYYERGLARADQGDLATAITDYNQAIALDPDYAAAYNSLCWSYSLQRQPELALPHCQRAVELNPTPGYYDSRGLVYALLDDFPAAIEDFQKYVDFLETSNDRAMSHYLEERKQWIATLKAGRNPFTSDVLEALKQE